MTNAALQAMINEYGERIALITFDNGYRIWIGYQSSYVRSASDLELKSFGDTDMVGVPHLFPNARNATAKKWLPTACIQQVVVMDEDSKRYRPDPLEA